MTATNSDIRLWENPPASQIGKDHIEFLRILGQPTLITVTGANSLRSRAIVTLLHGNEPSGIKAVHDFLLSGHKPVTDLHILIAGVDAALLPPLFSHRFLPGERDLNRCFGTVRDNDQGMLAGKVVDILSSKNPEVVIDVHNTSSHSPAFVVSCQDNERVRQITTLFTDKLIVVSKKLGTLLEQEIGEAPVITLEIGGIFDEGADRAAIAGLQRLATEENLFRDHGTDINLLSHPIRLELTPGHRVTYASTASAEADVTFPNTIDQLNFSSLKKDTEVGWLGDEGMSVLSATNSEQRDCVADLFYASDGALKTRTAMTLFMITTDSYIAEHDCILYLVPD